MTWWGRPLRSFCDTLALVRSAPDRQQAAPRNEEPGSARPFEGFCWHRRPENRSRAKTRRRKGRNKSRMCRIRLTVLVIIPQISGTSDIKDISVLLLPRSTRVGLGVLAPWREMCWPGGAGFAWWPLGTLASECVLRDPNGDRACGTLLGFRLAWGMSARREFAGKPFFRPAIGCYFSSTNDRRSKKPFIRTVPRP